LVSKDVSYVRTDYFEMACSEISMDRDTGAIVALSEVKEYKVGMEIYTSGNKICTNV
jgi:hypothetical protein